MSKQNTINSYRDINLKDTERSDTRYATNYNFLAHSNSGTVQKNKLRLKKKYASCLLQTTILPHGRKHIQSDPDNLYKKIWVTSADSKILVVEDGADEGI